MRKIISSFIMLALLLSLCVSGSGIVPAAAASSAKGDKTLVLHYDDYYVFEAAKSVLIPVGCSALSVSGNELHAINATDEPVSVTVDGEEWLVSVVPARVNIIIIDGQSNASGFYGTCDCELICPEKGNGYYCSGRALQDLRAWAESRLARNPSKSIGFLPALAEEWYRLSGEKTVAFSFCSVGAGIEYWNSSVLNSNTQIIKNGLELICNNKNYIVSHGCFYWFHGESNSINGAKGTKMNYTTTEEYMQAFSVVLDSYLDCFREYNIKACCGIFDINTVSNLCGYEACNEYCGVRAALQATANSREDVFMASTSIAACKRNSKEPFSFSAISGLKIEVAEMRSFFNDIHFNQTAYNIMGLEAADSIFSGWVMKRQTEDFLLYSRDGQVMYSDGDSIDINRIISHAQLFPPSDINAGQLVAVPVKNGAQCPKVEMSISLFGREIPGLIDNNGYIPSVDTLKPEMKLTVKMGNTKKTYSFIRPSYSLSVDPIVNSSSLSLEDINGNPISSAYPYSMVYVRVQQPALKAVDSVSLMWKESGTVLSAIIGEDGRYCFIMPFENVTVWCNTK